ncbi:MAG TPA: hypothetical protein VGX48_22845 [Pyrinomonadaceae bacterium]|jgi:hypothetical protein|nr:hypothetical protein [Pyrinomonadaceae bacterium]
MAYGAVKLGAGRTGIRYGWHDRFKIPLDHPSALRFYLDNLFVPHSRREMLWAAVARASARAGRAALPLLGVAAADRLKGKGAAPAGGQGAATDALVESLGARLKEAGLAPVGAASAITLDDYRHSEREKMVVFLFGRGERAPSVVAKVSGSAEHAAALAREHEALRALHARLGEELRATLPAPLATVEEGGLKAFAEGYVPGRSMYFEMRNAWLPRRRADLHFRLARRWLERFQKETTSDESALGAGRIREVIARPLKEYQRACSPSNDEKRFVAEVLRKAHALRGERVPVVARQGDFWARNLMVKGDALAVLDWENYAEAADPFSDLFLFTTSYGLSYPWRVGRWAEPAVAFRATYLRGGWMSRLVRRHLFGYCASMGLSRKLLEVFFPAFLAGRALEERARGRQTGSRKHSAGGGGTWETLFREYARTGGGACFGS